MRVSLCRPRPTDAAGGPPDRTSACARRGDRDLYRHVHSLRVVARNVTAHDQPTHGSGPPARSTCVDALARADDDSQAGRARRHRERRCRAGSQWRRVRLGDLPRILDRWSPMTASCSSRPPFTTWRRTVSPGTTSTAGGEKTSSRATMLTSRGRDDVPGVTGGVVAGPSEHPAAARQTPSVAARIRRATGRGGTGPECTGTTRISPPAAPPRHDHAGPASPGIPPLPHHGRRRPGGRLHARAAR